MATAKKKVADINQHIGEKQNGVILSVTVTEQQYLQILHTVEVLGFSDVNEWLLDAVLCHM